MKIEIEKHTNITSHEGVAPKEGVKDVLEISITKLTSTKDLTKAIKFLEDVKSNSVEYLRL